MNRRNFIKSSISIIAGVLAMAAGSPKGEPVIDEGKLKESSLLKLWEVIGKSSAQQVEWPDYNGYRVPDDVAKKLIDEIKVKQATVSARPVNFITPTSSSSNGVNWIDIANFSNRELIVRNDGDGKPIGILGKIGETQVTIEMVDENTDSITIG